MLITATQQAIMRSVSGKCIRNRLTKRVELGICGKFCKRGMLPSTMVHTDAAQQKPAFGRTANTAAISVWDPHVSAQPQPSLNYAKSFLSDPENNLKSM